MASSLSLLPQPETAGEISREELRRRLRDSSLVVVDVLPEEAYRREHIPGAVNLPLAELSMRATDVLPDRAAEIAVYCASFT
jgi:rhodanese-related sulfurtransferase